MRVRVDVRLVFELGAEDAYQEETWSCVELLEVPLAMTADSIEAMVEEAACDAAVMALATWPPPKSHR